ncbi:MAG: hypothetical protein O7F70_04050 [Gemmatimonadetes bacterium]|nr:hypothetical protein [Gemmatimonadota bacterium]
MKRKFFLASLLLLPATATAQEWRQTSADAYTRYELLDPASQSFRIIYDVSVTTPGATVYFNGIRRGSEPTVHAVYDLMTGERLDWEVVDGTAARDQGMLNANPEGQFVQVKLLRAVPDGGEVRLRINKTYRDPASYTSEGNVITFERSLGIRRNAIVLPEGFELIDTNYPSQIDMEADGRIRVSFMNSGPSAVSHVIRGRRLPSTASTSNSANPDRVETPTTTQTVPAGARVDYRFSERAFQDREIVYFLQQPETHSFRLYHDYTEGRAGVDRYVNVVRAGSEASNPSAKILDTGEELRVETLRGSEIGARGIRIGRQITPETEVVVIWFDPVESGHSVRLRIEETYTDPNRYVRVGDELIWDRSFGRPRNSVILPDGWFVTANAIPAVINETGDGRIRLYYENDRPGNIDVFIRARRR